MASTDEFSAGQKRQRERLGTPQPKDPAGGQTKSGAVLGHELLSVAIVGGGLGGLGLALALAQVGITRVTIFERDVFFGDRKQGYGLTLTNNPKGPLAKLGLLSECIRRDCASTCHWIFSPEGHVLGYYGRSFNGPGSSSSSSSSAASAEQQHGRGNLRVPRQDLRQLMLDRLPPTVSFVWGRRLCDYKESPSGVTLHWEDGSSSGEFDVVVGADGVRSVVRQLRDARLGQSKPAAAGSAGSAAAAAAAAASAGSAASSSSAPSSTAPAQGPGTAPGPSPGAASPASPAAGLRFVGVAVILGISTARHPLLRGQGFYVVDGRHRLFTMPFRDPTSGSGAAASAASAAGSAGSAGSAAAGSAGSAAAGSAGSGADPGSSGSSGVNSSSKGEGEGEGEEEREEGERLTMWQLSFSGLSEAEAAGLRLLPPQALLAEALRRTSSWFVPVQALLAATPAAEVWGTGLYDRAPLFVPKEKQQLPHATRVTVIGDAAHPMTMLKGQGCNQALADGPLLAGWLAGGPAAAAATAAGKGKGKGMGMGMGMDKEGAGDLAAASASADPSTTATDTTQPPQAPQAPLPQPQPLPQPLPRLALLTRLRCFERCMWQRAGPKVKASRAAAVRLHSPRVLLGLGLGLGLGEGQGEGQGEGHGEGQGEGQGQGQEEQEEDEGEGEGGDEDEEGFGFTITGWDSIPAPTQLAAVAPGAAATAATAATAAAASAPALDAAALLRRLCERGVGAHDAGALDARVRAVVLSMLS